MDDTAQRFLDFLDKDIQENPQRLVGLSPTQVERAFDLVSGVEFDPTETIDGDVSI